MRSASGDTSNNLSVGIFSPVSVVNSIPATAGVALVSVFASFARSAWLVDAERGFLLLELQQLQAELPFPRQLGLLLLRLLQS